MPSFNFRFGFVLLIFLYFSIHLVNLTILPIFNDEAIYLHWGLISIEKKGELFYPLFDGKQPLLMWVYGIFQRFNYDPLFVGRIISVTLGVFSLTGIYLTAKKLSDEISALIASLIYLIIPIFVFYNRLALMEAAIAAGGVWLFYLFLKTTEAKNKYYYAFFLGLVLGMMLFIKSSSFVFLVPLATLFLIEINKRKENDDRSIFFKAGITAFVISQIIIMPLFFQKEFMNMFKLSYRFTYSFTEILQLPIANWVKNVMVSTEIIFWYITPLVLIFALLGMFITVKRGERSGIYLVLWSLIAISTFIITVKSPSTKYIVAILPSISIFFAFGIRSLSKSLQLPVLIISIILPMILVFILLFFPIRFFQTMGLITDRNDSGYISDWTSGYGVKEVVDYIVNDVEKRGKVYAFLTVGNPDDALFIYFNKNNRIRMEYLWTEDCKKINDKFSRDKDQIYFISRDDNANSISDCFTEEKRFYKPVGESFVGVYKFNESK